MYTKDEDIGRRKVGIGGKMKLIMIDGLAAQIRDAVRAGRDPLEEANTSVRDFVTTRESASSDDLAETQDLVLIYPEVGSGVVPLDPEERAWREAVGRVGCR